MNELSKSEQQRLTQGGQPTAAHVQSVVDEMFPRHKPLANQTEFVLECDDEDDPEVPEPSEWRSGGGGIKPIPPLGA
jgi:hypothetical protein